MYQLKTSAAFDSAHFLANYPGKCANLHGHHWVIEVIVATETLQSDGASRGMAIDFHDLKSVLRALADFYDHALIYEAGTLKEATIAAMQAEGFRLIAVPFRPTAECFAKRFYEQLQEKSLSVESVTVYETSENCATYTALSE